MKVTVYHKKYGHNGNGLRDFLDVLLVSRMKYLASDLVYEGVPKEDIVQSVKDAMAVLDSANIKIEEHFRPVYTHIKGTLFKDFKMTQRGWYLVLLNLPPGSQFAHRIHISICEMLEGR